MVHSLIHRDQFFDGDAKPVFLLKFFEAREAKPCVLLNLLFMKTVKYLRIADGQLWLQ